MLGVVIVCAWLAYGVLITTLAGAAWSAPWPDKSERTYAHGRLNGVRIGLTVLTVGFAWSLAQMRDLWNLPGRIAVFLLLPIAVGSLWRRASLHHK